MYDECKLIQQAGTVRGKQLSHACYVTVTQM